MLDGIITESVDVQFELLWRSGGTDTTLATVQQHFDPTPTFEAQGFETDVDASAIDSHAGDLFVLRYTGTNSTGADAYIPNGDGAKTNGRDPNITLPP